MANRITENIERPCGGSNYCHPVKKNYCNSLRKCTAWEREERDCGYFAPGMIGGACSMRDGWSGTCMNADATEGAKT